LVHAIYWDLGSHSQPKTQRSATWYFWKRVEVLLEGCNGYQIYFVSMKHLGLCTWQVKAYVLQTLMMHKVHVRSQSGRGLAI
jgi:hypothetical protein